MEWYSRNSDVAFVWNSVLRFKERFSVGLQTAENGAAGSCRGCISWTDRIHTVGGFFVCYGIFQKTQFRFTGPGRGREFAGVIFLAVGRWSCLTLTVSGTGNTIHFTAKIFSSVFCLRRIFLFHVNSLIFWARLGGLWRILAEGEDYAERIKTILNIPRNLTLRYTGWGEWMSDVYHLAWFVSLKYSMANVLSDSLSWIFRTAA